MELTSLLGGSGAAGGGPSSSATASNSFGGGAFTENTLALIGLAIVAIFAIVLATRK